MTFSGGEKNIKLKRMNCGCFLGSANNQGCFTCPSAIEHSRIISKNVTAPKSGGTLLAEWLANFFAEYSCGLAVGAV
jgi:hypothetical protein